MVFFFLVRALSLFHCNELFEGAGNDFCVGNYLTANSVLHLFLKIPKIPQESLHEGARGNDSMQL